MSNYIVALKKMIFLFDDQINYVALSDPDFMKSQQGLGPFHMNWRTTLHAIGLLKDNSRNAYICIIPGKLSENHLDRSLRVSNLGDKSVPYF